MLALAHLVHSLNQQDATLFQHAQPVKFTTLSTTNVNARSVLLILTESVQILSALLDNIGTEELAKLLTAHLHHISTRIDAFMDLLRTAVSDIFGTESNAFIILQLAHLEHHGARTHVKIQAHAEMDIIKVQEAAVLPSLNNALLPLNGMARNVLLLEISALKELTLKETNVILIKPALMDLCGTLFT